MTNEALATIGVALSRIATRIDEQIGDADGTPPALIFEHCLDREVIRLRKDGQPAAAEMINTIRHPVARALREGW